MKLRGLYAITDGQLLTGRFLSYVEAALDGGVTLLQYRDKSSDESRRLREASELLKLCERYKTRLIINDDAELAARLGVGVHLGKPMGRCRTPGLCWVTRRLSGRPAMASWSWPNGPRLTGQVTLHSGAFLLPGPSPMRRPCRSNCWLKSVQR